MSGILGVLNLDGAPVETAWLEGATRSLAFRGPDGQSTWVEGPAGLGTALLRTAFESGHEQQPCSLDGKTWISADARVDGREELLRELQAGGHQASGDSPDVELILKAYGRWGRQCVDHLIGDFAFILWDGRRRELFCARDQFGAAPLYYARTGSTLVVSNTLNAVRLHPGISDELDEQSVGDFLLFNLYQSNDSTIFAGIRRLPPAHTLLVKDGELRIQRYWSPPEEIEIVRPKRPEEMVEQFRGLFEQAVNDRLRTDHIGTAVSGGLDSTSIAATAQHLLQAGGRPFELRGTTIVYQHFFPDREGEFAEQVSQHCGFPTEIFVADEYMIRQPTESPAYPLPEPWAVQGMAPEEAILQRVAEYARVYLMGFGGDPLLSPARLTWQAALRLGDFLTPLAQLRRDAQAATRRWTEKATESRYPNWVEPSFDARSGLRQRWQERMQSYSTLDQRRGMTFEPLWEALFRVADPGFTGKTVKYRAPFFDLRLLTFMLSVPPYPWCRRKYLLRQAMRGTLPETVRQRPKTILQGQPFMELLKENGTPPWMATLAAAPELAPYVNQAAFKELLMAPQTLKSSAFMTLYPTLALADWLRRAQRS